MNTSTVATRSTRLAGRLAALTLAAGTLSLLGTAASAQNSSDAASLPAVTVQASPVVQHRSFGTNGLAGEQLLLTRHVNYADLNLDTPEGKIALHRRIRDSARAACQELEARYPLELWTNDVQTCVQNAMLTWMPVIHGFPTAAQE